MPFDQFVRAVVRPARDNPVRLGNTDPGQSFKLLRRGLVDVHGALVVRGPLVLDAVFHALYNRLRILGGFSCSLGSLMANRVRIALRRSAANGGEQGKSYEATRCTFHNSFD